MGRLDVPSNHRAAKPLNSADWQRIEAALNEMVWETDLLPAGAAYARTLDKVQSRNLTGKYTLQGGTK